MCVRYQVQLVVSNSSFRPSVENTPFSKRLCAVRGDSCSVAYTTQIAASGTDMAFQVQWQKMQISRRLSIISYVHGSSDLYLL